MSDTDRDTLMRMAAIEHVRRLSEVYDHLTAEELKPGFVFEGERIPLVNPQRGIFKPRQMKYLLSIKTVSPRPGARVWYDDQRDVHRQIFEGDEMVEYAFMGQNPDAADNRWLGTKFLMNPRGRHFSRIKASELLLLDAEDKATMVRPDAPDPTAWALHGGIHRRMPHARCLLHVHSRYAAVLACLADPTLPPIDQNAMRFWGRITIDEDFDGMGLDDEAERIARLVGDKPILLMRNHGVMAIGETVARAFDDLYYFERACSTYITALQTGRELGIVSGRVAAKTAQQWRDYPDLSEDHFRELQEILDREDPSFRR